MHPPYTSLALLDGMGSAIGDCVLGLQALKLLKRRHPALHLGLFRGDHRRASDWFHQHSPVGPFHPIPKDTTTLLGFERVLDLRDVQSHEDFYVRPIIDFFLRCLELNPESVHPDDKRPTWLNALPRAEGPLFLPNGQRYALLNLASAAPARAMPDRFAARLARLLKARYPELAVVFTGITDARMSVLDPAHRCINGTGILTSSEVWLAALADAELLITPDSAPYHLAEGVGARSLVFFTNVAPAARISDYWHAVGVDLDPHRAYSDWMERYAPEQLEGIDQVWDRLPDDDLEHALAVALQPLGGAETSPPLTT